MKKKTCKASTSKLLNKIATNGLRESVRRTSNPLCLESHIINTHTHF